MQLAKHKLQELIKEAIVSHSITVNCPICNGIIWCEPDAETTYCCGCKKKVTDFNPLIKLGLI